MEHNGETIGLAGLSLGLFMTISSQLGLQVIMGIGIPLLVLVAGHFIKRGLNKYFPLGSKEDKDI